MTRKPLLEETKKKISNSLKGHKFSVRYKIILSNSKEIIVIREEELEKVLRGIQEGSPVIVQEGIFNPSFFVAILPDYERAKLVKGGFSEPSPFAKLISKKMGVLPAEKRRLK